MSNSDSWLSWLCLPLLLFLAAYFAVAEVSVTSVSRIRLRARLEMGDRRAEKALYIQDRFESAISAILIGTNIVHISTATLTTVLVTRRWGSGFVALGTVACTCAVFFAGEMLPKSIGKRYCETFALSTAPSLCLIMKLFAPLSGALAAIGRCFTRLTGAEEEVSVTRDELFDIIDTMTDEGNLDSDCGELVQSALEFDGQTIGRIMTPRDKMLMLNADNTPEQIAEAVRSSHISRLPVYRDNPDRIIGILQTRRYARLLLRKEAIPSLEMLLDEPFLLAPSMPVDLALEEMNRRKQGLAVVAAEGKTLGLVTAEDILEELVGEIYDEDDTPEGGASV